MLIASSGGSGKRLWTPGGGVFGGYGLSGKGRGFADKIGVGGSSTFAGKLGVDIGCICASLKILIACHGSFAGKTGNASGCSYA